MELTLDGYTFKNQPTTFSKSLDLSNSPQRFQNRQLPDFFVSDSQQIRFRAAGELSTTETEGQDELDELQQKGINQGEVRVEFDPFFTGECVIMSDPFGQSVGRSTYEFALQANTDETDTSDWHARDTPDTGNTFKYAGLDLAFDPDSVSQAYDRQTVSVNQLEGISQATDQEGLVTEVQLSGRIDGGGQAELWEKARQNVLGFLQAEFQTGRALVTAVDISYDPATPDYIKGLYTYSASFLVVQDPNTGIGQNRQTVNRQTQRSGTYVSFTGHGSVSTSGLTASVTGGTGAIPGSSPVQWRDTDVSLTDNATNSIYVDDSDGDGFGTVEVSTSGFPSSGVLPLHTVTTSGGSVTGTTDERDILVEETDNTSAALTPEETLQLTDEFDVQEILKVAEALNVDAANAFKSLHEQTETLSMSDAVAFLRALSFAEQLGLTASFSTKLEVQSILESLAEALDLKPVVRFDLEGEPQPARHGDFAAHTERRHGGVFDSIRLPTIDEQFSMTDEFFTVLNPLFFSDSLVNLNANVDVKLGAGARHGERDGRHSAFRHGGTT